MFHAMKIVDILDEHHENVLDLTITVSSLSLQLSSPPLFLNLCNFFVKNVNNKYSTY